MAHIEEQGGKTSSVVELNLVPFIDLMSVCIIFLLITAVWTQVSMLQLGSSVYSQQTDADPGPAPPLRGGDPQGGCFAGGISPECGKGSAPPSPWREWRL